MYLKGMQSMRITHSNINKNDYITLRCINSIFDIMKYSRRNKRTFEKRYTDSNIVANITKISTDV